MHNLVIKILIFKKKINLDKEYHLYDDVFLKFNINDPNYKVVDNKLIYLTKNITHYTDPLGKEHKLVINKEITPGDTYLVKNLDHQIYIYFI